MNWIEMIFLLLGGLGLFFYGIRQFSDALQALGGDIVRKIFGVVTKNRVLGVLTGIVVTCLVQSSSVSTVLTIGFVNAGLMQLTQAISIIFGANIGTTITGWIIAIKIGKYGMHMVGVGAFPLLFTKDTRWQNFGRVIFGLGLVFIGLETMSDAFRPLRTYQPFLILRRVLLCQLLPAWSWVVF
jgi:phosphate:Na+ symporter